MAWKTRRDLPPGWEKLRKTVRARAGDRCENVVDGQRCPMQGRECDHIAGRDDHRLANLQWLCPPCHRAKTSAEAQAARITTARAIERHPGLTDGAKRT